MKLHINKFQIVGKTPKTKHENKSALDFLISKTPLKYNHRLQVRFPSPAPSKDRVNSRVYSVFLFIL